MLGRFTAALGLAFAVSIATAQAQTFRFSPSADVLAGDPVEVAIEGLPPGAEVEVRTERAFANLWRSSARFRADADGRVRLADAPLSGDWTGADAAGAFWSLKDSKERSPAGREREEVRFTALRDGTEVVAGSLRLVRQSPDVTVEPVPGLPGAVFAYPEGAKRLPVLVVLGGSEGDDSTAKSVSPRFASRGYAVLGLPYYSPAWGEQPQALPGLPRSFVDIPVDRLEAARAWLRGRPEADVEHFGLYGVSKGAEFALIAASRYRWIDAVVAIVPTDVVWEGWGPDAKAGASSSFAFGGRALPFVPYADIDKVYAPETPGVRRPTLAEAHANGRYRAPAAAVEARIPVERIRAPVLVAGGGQDVVWPSATMTQAIAERRLAAGLPVESYLFPDAGHGLSGDGWSPADEAEARAQRVVYPATLAFLRRNLAGAR